LGTAYWVREVGRWLLKVYVSVSSGSELVLKKPVIVLMPALNACDPVT
jgi:hypothetical protein